jgi:hypothetical protein
MASPSAIEKRDAFTAKIKANESKRSELAALANPTTAQKAEIRKLTNQISSDKAQFAKDPDLLKLAGENMSAGDKLFALGLGSGTVTPGGIGVPPVVLPLVTTAAAVQGTEIIASGLNAPAAAKEPEPEKTKEKKEKLKLYPLPNTLHQYPGYTYGLSLHLLTSDEYNEVMKSQKYTPKRVLVASAGRFNTLDAKDPMTFIRSSHFNEDFYFDDFNLTTLIKPNDVSRNTNAIDGGFTLIEPYGVTLLNRILNVSKEINSPNYLENVYLIQIDFFANNDAGETLGILPELTKRIPIKIIKFDVRASQKGAEYKIQFVPFNHSAYNLTSVTNPAVVTVVAGSVAQFFQSGAVVGNDDVQQREEAQNGYWRTADGKWVGSDGQFVGTNTQPTALLNSKTQKDLSKVSSYSAALNTWASGLATNKKIGIADTYSFDFDPAIGDAQFTKFSQRVLSPKDTKMADTGDITIEKSNLGKATDSYNTFLREFRVNPGTSIEKVINTIVRNSDYIQNQLIIPEDYGNKPLEYYKKAKEANANEPLHWFKIVPIIKLNGFDPIRKIWARDITYYVKTYDINNLRIDVAPQGVAEYPVKAYNFIYSGQNDDILELDIKFEAMYYTAITVYRDAAMDYYNTAANSSEEYKNKNSAGYDGVDTDPNSIMPGVVKPVVNNSRGTTSSGTVTARAVAASDLEESLMTLAEADMLNLKLKILGDPMFIKQDDIFYAPKNPKNAIYETNKQPSDDPRLTPNNSIRTDDGEIYVQILIRTPIDIDESTGLMKFDQKYQLSVFSGLYAILRIDSQFSKGQFIQTLDLVRLSRQIKYDYVGTTTPKDTKERKTDVTAKNTAAAPSESATIVGNKNTTTDSAGDAGDNDQTGQEQTANADNPPPVESKSQSDLRSVKDTAPTQPIDANTRPPQLGNNATDAQLAQNYRQKAAYMRNLATKYPDDPEYLDNAAQYDQWAARRQALADGTSTQ